MIGFRLEYQVRVLVVQWKAEQTRKKSKHPQYVNSIISWLYPIITDFDLNKCRNTCFVCESAISGHVDWKGEEKVSKQNWSFWWPSAVTQSGARFRGCCGYKPGCSGANELFVFLPQREFLIGKSHFLFSYVLGWAPRCQSGRYSLIKLDLIYYLQVRFQYAWS